MNSPAPRATFDLARHGIDEVIGKVIELAGSFYAFESFIAEGGEKWVYHARNVRTQMSHFALKIYKFRRSSPQMKKQLPDMRATCFVLYGSKFIARTLIFEHGDVVIELQNLAGSASGPLGGEYGDAVKLVEEGEVLRAITVCDESLALAPDHDLFLALRSECFRRLGLYATSLSMANAALAVESNLTEHWLRKADILTELGAVEEAVAALAEHFRLCPCDGTVWRHAFELCCKHLRIEEGGRLIELLKLLPLEEDRAVEYVSSLEEARLARVSYRAAVERKPDGTGPGKDVLERLVRSYPHFSYPRLLLCLRLFKDAAFAACRECALEGLREGNVRAKDYYILFGGLAEDRLGRPLEAVHYFGHLYQHIENEFDLPCVPVDVLHASGSLPEHEQLAFLEAISSDPIVDTILRLKMVPEIRPQADFLAELAERYRKRDRAMANAK